MSFRLSSDCDSWFAHIADREPLKRKFDYYYLCLLLGLAARRKSKLPDDTREFVDEFLSSYRPYQRQIIGLLIRVHLDNQGVGVEEKKAVAEQISKIVATDRTAQLTDQGFSLLNEYAFGGFLILKEELDQPHNIVFFLQKYYQLLDEHLRKNPVFAELLAAAEVKN